MITDKERLAILKKEIAKMRHTHDVNWILVEALEGVYRGLKRSKKKYKIAEEWISTNPRIMCTDHFIIMYRGRFRPNVPHLDTVEENIKSQIYLEVRGGELELDEYRKVLDREAAPKPKSAVK